MAQTAVMQLAAEGVAYGRANAADLVGEAMVAGAGVLAVPVSRLDPAFFELTSGVAGEVAQKCVNYRVRLAIIGDISAHLERSNALRDWVRECNRGRHLLFVADRAELEARLAKPSA